MSDKMQRFQTILKENALLRDRFNLTYDEIGTVADAINYIWLPFDDNIFAQILHRIVVYIEYKGASEHGDRKIIGGTTTIDHDVIDQPIPGFNSVLHYAISKITLKTELRMTDRSITISLSDNQYDMQAYGIMNIACTRSALYTAEKSGITLPSVDHEQALKCLKDDIEQGITEYLESYIINCKDEIKEILEICNENQWNDLTMVILRICEDNGIRSESEIRL